MFSSSTGTATVEPHEGVVPEYAAAAAERYFGPVQGPAWIEGVKGMGLEFARISIAPAYHGNYGFRDPLPECYHGRLATSPIGSITGFVPIFSRGWRCRTPLETHPR